MQINVDEGWLKGRNAAGQMYEDTDKFPSGMKALGDWIKAQSTYAGSPDRMRYGATSAASAPRSKLVEPTSLPSSLSPYSLPTRAAGLYSCRGTCQCGTGTYNAPGSNGHEKDDVEWMVAAGAQFLKIDSCCGDQDHAVAFSDYTKWRDAINATGERVWFSLCGWEDWYSPPDPSLNYTGGASLGNSWRIAGDGGGWGPLTNCMNTQAAAAPYAGPGGWPDPDLLIGVQGYIGGQSDEQARSQFTMWSIFPANVRLHARSCRRAWAGHTRATHHPPTSLPPSLLFLCTRAAAHLTERARLVRVRARDL